MRLRSPPSYRRPQVRLDEMEEHMRISLLDPKWKEQKLLEAERRKVRIQPHAERAGLGTHPLTRTGAACAGGSDHGILCIPVPPRADTHQAMSSCSI